MTRVKAPRCSILSYLNFGDRKPCDHPFQFGWVFAVSLQGLAVAAVFPVPSQARSLIKMGEMRIITM